jgi:hypothetical protein
MITDCGAISGMNEWQWKLKYQEKTCPSAGLFTTNATNGLTGIESRTPDWGVGD